jgi:hypothetical protein
VGAASGAQLTVDGSSAECLGDAVLGLGDVRRFEGEDMREHDRMGWGEREVEHPAQHMADPGWIPVPADANDLAAR